MVETGKNWSPERVKKEICDLIDENKGIFHYKLEREVGVDDIVTIKLVLEMYQNPEGKKVAI